MDHGEPDPLKPAMGMFSEHYSPELLSTVDWCLELSANDRPQTVRDVQEAIVNGAPSLAEVRKKTNKADPGDSQQTDPGGADDNGSKQPWYANNKVIGSLVSVVALCVVGAVYFLTQSGGKSTPSVSSADMKVEEARSLHARASRDMGRISSLNVAVSPRERAKLSEDLIKVERLLDQDKPEPALDVANDVLIQQAILLSTRERKFDAGSSNEEIQSAYDLCVESIGENSCAIEWFEDERTVSVQLEPFILDQAAVSFGDFSEFVADRAYRTTAEGRGLSLQQVEEFDIKVLDGFNWKQPEGATGRRVEELDEFPVVHVSYVDAVNYCSYKDKRLPTRFEWEYAMSGGSMKAFADYFSLQNQQTPDYSEPRIAATSVLSESIRDANTGFYGGSGNIWEWTDTPDSSGDNKRYTKGGSWNEPSAAFKRLAALRSEYVEDSYVDVGFRCARDADRWPVRN